MHDGPTLLAGGVDKISTRAEFTRSFGRRVTFLPASDLEERAVVLTIAFEEPFIGVEEEEFTRCSDKDASDLRCRSNFFFPRRLDFFSDGAISMALTGRGLGAETLASKRHFSGNMGSCLHSAEPEVGASKLISCGILAKSVQVLAEDCIQTLAILPCHAHLYIRKKGL